MEAIAVVPPLTRPRMRDRLARFVSRMGWDEPVFIEEGPPKKEWRLTKIGAAVQELSGGTAIVLPCLGVISNRKEVLDFLLYCRQNELAVYTLDGIAINGSADSAGLGQAVALLANLEAQEIQAKRMGRRPSKLDPYQEIIVKMLRNGATKKAVAKRFDTTYANLHSYIKSRGLDVRPRI